MAWVYYILLIAVQLAGLFINLLGLPGLSIMVAATGIFAWLTRSPGYVSNVTLIVLLMLALAAEVAEFLASSAGTKKAGGSKRGMMGAVIGGILGGIFLSFIPIPIISTIVGVCLGCFIGAAVVEMMIKQDVQHSVRVGLGAAQGRFYGIVIKLGFGFGILLTSIVAAFPTGGTSTAIVVVPLPGRVIPTSTSLPTSIPATVPSAVPSAAPSTQR